MAAVTPPTAMTLGGDVRVQVVQYGATIDLGDPLYLDPADGLHKPTDSNASSTTAAIVGVALTPGVNTGYGVMATQGTLGFTGSTFVLGSTYFCGQSSGAVIPHADLATNDWVSRVGTAFSTSQLKLSIEATGIQHA
jgi:hypothetical protein